MTERASPAGRPDYPAAREGAEYVHEEPGSAETDRTGDGTRGARAGALTPAEFETMTVELSRPLFATALRLTRNRDDAEDLVQESLYRAYRSLHTFRKGTRFRAWLFRILHNAFINRLRRAQLAPAATDPADLDPSDAEHPIPDLRSLGELPEVADRHFDERVKAAVDALPETFRAPLVLFSLGDLSYQEIADALEIPIGTVMSRLHRARRLLRVELAAYAREHGLGNEGGRE